LLLHGLEIGFSFGESTQRVVIRTGSMRASFFSFVAAVHQFGKMLSQSA